MSRDQLRAIRRIAPSVESYTARVSAVDTSLSPHEFTIGGRKMMAVGAAPVVGDLVVVLRVQGERFCLGAVVGA